MDCQARNVPPLFFKWVTMITIIVLLPMSFTFLHLFNLFVSHNAAPWDDVPHLFAPSIVQLLARLEGPARTVLDSSPRVDPQEQQQQQEHSLEKQSLDYRRILSLDTNFLNLLSSSPETRVSKKKSHIQGDVDVDTINQFGFRTNGNKEQKKDKGFGKMYPLATYFWIIINVGLFVLYLVQNVDPSMVALNGRVIHDYGRAITGNLAHFEIWHVGLNMMSAWMIGPTLEDPIFGWGTIQLFLYTASFLALNTLMVLGLHYLWSKFRNTQGNTLPLPNMVGFSGILFTWSVVSTLQMKQETCPIPILPNLCFGTYQLAGGRLSVSLGPLVQLVFLQVVLPRVSFLGHLAGIVVGFLWHWNVLPPLEYLQPCLVYPIVWGIGKWYSHSENHLRPRTSGGTTLAWSTFRSSALYTLLKYTRTALMVHLAMMSFLILVRAIATIRVVVMDSIMLSQALLIAILNVMIERIDDKRLVGVIGRGLVVMVLVVVITDAMTLTGWLTLLDLWWHTQQAIWTLLLVFWCVRFLLWALLLGLVCQTLNLANELVGDPGRDSFDDIWTQLLGWSVVDACIPLGKMLADYISIPTWQDNGRAIAMSTRTVGGLIPSSSQSSSSSVSRLVTTTSVGEVQYRTKQQTSPGSTTMTDESSSRVVSDIV